jgi:hypothetical protein
VFPVLGVLLDRQKNNLGSAPAGFRGVGCHRVAL